MGCDIHSYVEKLERGIWIKVSNIFPRTKWEKSYFKSNVSDHPFNWRSYGIFGFLADVRNYSHSPVISASRGLPMDVSSEIKLEADDWGCDGHSFSFLMLDELLNFDYDQIFWDRRITKQVKPNFWDGAALAEDEETEGEHISLRKFLDGAFFEQLEIMKKLGDPKKIRIVFWFDN